MKKLFLIALLCVFAIGQTMASGTTEKETKSDGQAEIVYSTFSASPNHLEELNEIVSIFNEKEKDINVSVETVGWDDYFTRLDSQIAGGIAPDVFEVNYESFVSYASKDVLTSLESVQGWSEQSDKYYPKAYSAFEYGGRQYGLPETFSTSVVFYNKELFDKAGLQYPDSTWDWDQVIGAAKKINTQDGVWGMYSPIQFWEFYKKAAQNGGSLLSSDGKTVTVDAPENVEALNFMVNLIEKHGVMPTEEDLGGVSNEQAFLDGKIGILVSGIWMFDTFKDADFEWDIIVEPGLKSKACHFFANGLVMSKNTKHPEAAAKWIEFFTSNPEMVSIRMSSNWELPAIQNLELVEDYINKGNPENRKAVYDSLNYIVVPPVVEKQSKFQDVVGRAIEEVLLGTKTASEALAEADKKAQQLIE